MRTQLTLPGQQMHQGLHARDALVPQCLCVSCSFVQHARMSVDVIIIARVSFRCLSVSVRPSLYTDAHQLPLEVVRPR